ncbi:carbohydrate ABC transporter permease [Agromyces sp. Soil535]|uniref:carbohydrate ABC transporter permease n=1 Tax=Agromyces sp. Soil535 TaxID=1736390 RepID=UPI0006F4662F|nr:carbohydrate ABC transporter permease [Agromyces sp. Soil535]KRE31383.1 sugar ABC transporter permease [Agromyces sp. Soil535]
MSTSLREPTLTGSLPASTASADGHSRRKPRRALTTGAKYAVLVTVTALFFAPIAYMLIGSFKPSDEVLDGLGGFLPVDLSFDNYLGVITRFDSPATGYFANFYLTSAIVAVVVVGGGLVVNSMAAYALARLRWRGRNSVLMLVIILVILPFEAIAVPLYYLMNDYRNTYFVQFIPFVASAFSIFLFYTFFIGLPAEIQESARLDGAGPWRVFWQIVVPMSKPVFASVTILSFLAAWSSFLFPVMMIDQPQYRPLPLEIAVFKAQPPTDWGQIFAFGVLLVIPVVIVFLLFQRWFIQSVASSAMKG